MINIAILGYGTVGSGVAELVEKNKEEIKKKAGDEIQVKYILDIRDFPGDPNEKKVVREFNQIVDDPEISVICETMGGIRPAYDFTKRALLDGKSVCTSNKELVAAHGPELLRIAREKKCNYLFEASVGGGIPIIRLLNYTYVAEEIESIIGILNGTTNYVLSKMEQEEADFATVLKEAQALGFAENNPEADVEGLDACRKIAILASLMCGQNVRSEEIYTEGITAISVVDFRYAQALDMTIKLLAKTGYDEKKGLSAYVAPFLLGKEHPLAFVHGVNNAVFVRSNMLGDAMYYGRGAGKQPTAGAVVADIVHCARHIGKTIACLWEGEDLEITPMAKLAHRFFVRIHDSHENVQRVSALFPAIHPLPPLVEGESAFICGPLSEAEFAAHVAALPAGIIGRIRIAEA
jgi:homoserine dehydrogenase